MDPILEEQLKQRRIIAWAQCHQQIMGENKDDAIDSQTGNISGRAVKPIVSTNSKESRIYESHILSTVKDQVLSHYVNNVKQPNQDFFYHGSKTYIRV